MQLLYTTIIIIIVTRCKVYKRKEDKKDCMKWKDIRRRKKKKETMKRKKYRRHCIVFERKGEQNLVKKLSNVNLG